MTAPRRRREPDNPVPRGTFAILAVVAVALAAAETYAWVTIARVGLDHAPGWALWLAFAGR